MDTTSRDKYINNELQRANHELNEYKGRRLREEIDRDIIRDRALWVANGDFGFGACELIRRAGKPTVLAVTYAIVREYQVSRTSAYRHALKILRDMTADARGRFDATVRAMVWGVER